MCDFEKHGCSDFRYVWKHIIVSFQTILKRTHQARRFSSHFETVLYFSKLSELCTSMFFKTHIRRLSKKQDCLRDARWHVSPGSSGPVQMIWYHQSSRLRFSLRGGFDHECNLPGGCTRACSHSYGCSCTYQVLRDTKLLEQSSTQLCSHALWDYMLRITRAS